MKIAQIVERRIAVAILKPTTCRGACSDPGARANRKSRASGSLCPPHVACEQPCSAARKSRCIWFDGTLADIRLARHLPNYGIGPPLI